METKKSSTRKKALEHYYNNIEYYRKYYIDNKEKLLKYNKEYAKKRSMNDKDNNNFKIEYKSIIVNFD